MDVLLLGVAVLYFIPTFVAVNRKHSSAGAIFLVNLLLGWSFLGWVLALVWAASDFDDPRKKVRLIDGRYVTDAELRHEYGDLRRRKIRDDARARIWGK